MSKLNTKLSEVLDIEPISDELEQTTAIDVIDNSDVLKSEEILDSIVETDTDYARSNIKDLISKGNTAIDNILSVAKESEHPRAYEVAANFLKTISDLNKDLLELQKRKKDLQPKNLDGPKNINVDKAVFIGSTAELLKQIKERK